MSPQALLLTLDCESATINKDAELDRVGLESSYPGGGSEADKGLAIVENLRKVEVGNCIFWANITPTSETVRESAL